MKIKEEQEKNRDQTYQNTLNPIPIIGSQT